MDPQSKIIEMADEEEKKNKPVGDQESAWHLDWKSNNCQIFIKILVYF